ncbi:hypothetical protein HAX54_009490 [Datura stramonium]|uniref:Transcription repressor n=1 Tax=Datura stramonium TaxID=4076 RepID=A0ABS8WXG7_DATST|nr:hypothetical protein [Datura stramonium]
MGNYRFRLSDMVPNAWFYKLKDMGKSTRKIKRKQTSLSSLSSSSSSIFSSSSNLEPTKTQPPHHNLSYQRKSYYFSRNLSPNCHQSNETLLYKNPASNSINFSEKSSKKRRSSNRRKTSISSKCVNSTVWTKYDFTPEVYPNSPFSSSNTTCSSVHSPKTYDAMILSASCHCNDLVIDMNKNDDSVSIIDLPPIITKPQKLADSTNGTKKKEEKTELKSSMVKKKEESTSTSTRRRGSSMGVKLRTKSPRLVSRKSVSNSSTKLSVGESFAVVKSSKDPYKDFKESMVEMIVENNIRASKDLEDLLACYLSLNSHQYHHLIIKVFKQIWFDIQLK